MLRGSSNLSKQLMKNRQKLIVAFIWILLILVFWLLIRQQGLSLSQLLEHLVDFAQNHPLGILAVFLAFQLRSILLLPSTLLAVATGFLYGPTFGFIMTMVATLCSIVISYYIAAYFRKDANENQAAQATQAQATQAQATQQSNRLTSFRNQLKKHPFQSTLIARLVFMPGDLVNFTAGLLKINLLAFLFASAIGGTPGTLVSVLAGASIEGDFSTGAIELRTDYLIVATIILLLSILLSWFVKKWQRAETKTR